MRVNFDPDHIRVEAHGNFADDLIFKKSLEKMCIATDSEAQNYSSLAGNIRLPQESEKKPEKKDVPLINGLPIAHSKRVNTLEERQKFCTSTIQYYATHGIKAEELNITYFKFETKDGELTAEEKEKESRVVHETILDFFDYILPIVTEDSGNDVSVTQITYSSCSYPLNGIPVVSVICKTTESTYVKQLWFAFIKALQKIDRAEAESAKQKENSREEKEDTNSDGVSAEENGGDDNAEESA